MQVSNGIGIVSAYDPDRIYNSIKREIPTTAKYYDLPPLSDDQINSVVRKVEASVTKLGLEIITESLIRNLVYLHLPEGYRDAYSTVGMTVHQAFAIDLGKGDGDNANLQHNPETSHKRKADDLSKKEALFLLPRDLAHHHIDGDLHIHDLEYFTTRIFCLDADMRYTFYYGFTPDGNGEFASVAGAAKRAEVAVLHAVKALSASQCACAGGQGYYNFLTFLAPYVEGLPYDEIKHLMQMFVYEMTQMMVARGGQVVFSSVQLTPGVPKLWKDKPVVYRGKIYNGNQAMLRTYGEFEREVRLLFGALMDVMLVGDHRGKPFMFPKPEISIEKQFIDDDIIDKPHMDAPSYRDLYLKAFKLASKFGSPYFDNMIPEYRGTEDQIACVQCCAYFFGSGEDSDPLFAKKLQFEDGQHFTMGSLQVVTLNLPRIAYNSESIEQFIDNAKDLIDASIRIFQVKRAFIDKMFEKHRMGYLAQRLIDPYTQKPGASFLNLDDFVYTIGIIGMNEVVQHMTGSPIYRDGLTTAMKIVMSLRAYAIDQGKKNGITVAFARTPAETTGQRFAYLDLKDQRYKHHACKVIQGDVRLAEQQIMKGISDIPAYYTNGAHVPPVVNIPITERIQKEGVFHPLLDGGNITHIWLGEAHPDARGLMDFALNISKNTLTGYYAFTRDTTVHRRRYWVI